MNLIETDRFIIREWMSDDAVGLVKARRDPSIAIGLCETNNRPYNLERALEHIKLSQKEGNSSFAITIDDAVAGEIGCVFRDKSPIASVNYWISIDYRRQGIATEALKLFTGYIFKKHPVWFIEASVLEWNTASIRVQEKAGYILKTATEGSDTDIYFKVNTDYIWKRANNLKHVYVRQKKSARKNLLR